MGFGTLEKPTTSRLIIIFSVIHIVRGFPRPFTHGGFVPPKALWGGLMRGDIDLMRGGPNFDRLYHKLKVLLLLSCNYIFQIRTITQHQ